MSVIPSVADPKFQVVKTLAAELLKLEPAALALLKELAASGLLPPSFNLIAAEIPAIINLIESISKVDFSVLG